MVNGLRKPISIICTTYTDNPELSQLVKLNGGYRQLVQPITPEKLKAIAEETIESCRRDEADCSACIYTWCKYRNTAGD